MHSRSPTVALSETGVGVLLRRHRLAGERRLFGAQVLRLEEPQVGRNLVAQLEEHDVPRNELLRGEHARLAAAHRPGLGGKHVADRIQRLLGPAFLDEPEQPVENDHGEDDRRVDPQAQHQFGEPGGEKNVDKDVVELGEEPHERAPLLALRQAVRPIFLQPGRGLGGVEAFFTALVASRFTTSSTRIACHDGASVFPSGVAPVLICRPPSKSASRLTFKAGMDSAALVSATTRVGESAHRQFLPNCSKQNTLSRNRELGKTSQATPGSSIPRLEDTQS